MSVNYVLKIVKMDGIYYPDTEADDGTFDYLQQLMFKHLIPCGVADCMTIEALEVLAMAHGWYAKYREIPPKVSIKITDSSIGFPFGTMSDENRKFVAESLGKVFKARLHNVNYYRLESGMLVHVYNAKEVQDEPG
jgi:hypothetical protein